MAATEFIAASLNSPSIIPAGPNDVAMNRSASPPQSGAPAATAGRYEIVDFAQVTPVACPCGWARRAFAETADFPGTLHVTEITADARLHYHRRLTEIYFVLDCQPDAQLQLDEQRVQLRPGLCILIRPGVRHRAIGRMKLLILVFPKFDADDEWFD